MSPESFPHPDLRRRLAELGISPARHAMRELLKLLPAALPRRPYDEASADAVAEVLIYLAEKNVLSLPCLEDPLWGERLCQFYRTREELLALALPFLAQGLATNERCIWVAGDALASQAGDMLREAGDQLEIVDYAGLDLWQREESRALAQGYNGLRLCADAAYEAQVDAAMEGRRIKALCTHPEG
jgi:hypothetical protein